MTGGFALIVLHFLCLFKVGKADDGKVSNGFGLETDPDHLYTPNLPEDGIDISYALPRTKSGN